MRHRWIWRGISVGCARCCPRVCVGSSQDRKAKTGRDRGEVVSAKGAPVAGAQILWQAADGSKTRMPCTAMRRGAFAFRASDRPL